MPKIEWDYLKKYLTAVPTVFLNQDLVAMQPTLSNLEALIRLARAEAQGLPEGPPPPAGPELAYRLVLETTAGPIEIQLVPAVAPQAVGNLVYLAEQGWYDGTIFHREVPGVLAETGDPTHTGLAGPASRFADELEGGLSFDEVGMVAMQSEGPDSNGGAFFVNLRPLPQLDGSRTILGRVVSGIELLQALPARDPLTDLLSPAPLVIDKVTPGPRRSSKPGKRRSTTGSVAGRISCSWRGHSGTARSPRTRETSASSKRALDNALEEAVVPLKAGELAPWVQAKNGWYRLKLEEKKDSRLKPYDEVKKDIWEKLFMQKKTTNLGEFLKDLRAKNYIKILKPNPLEGQEGAGRQGDRLVNGKAVEYKTPEPGVTPKKIANRVKDSVRGTARVTTGRS